MTTEQKDTDPIDTTFVTTAELKLLRRWLERFPWRHTTPATRALVALRTRLPEPRILMPTGHLKYDIKFHRANAQRFNAEWFGLRTMKRHTAHLQGEDSERLGAIAHMLRRMRAEPGWVGPAPPDPVAATQWIVMPVRGPEIAQ